MIDLKPCPFCGGEAKTTASYWWHGTWYGTKVHCTAVDCTAATEPAAWADGPSALEQWNRRAQ